MITLAVAAQAQAVRIAAIGDFGTNDANAAAVAARVRALEPDFVITMGDNDYSDGLYRGTSEGYELAVGQHYGSFVDAGTFYPSPGNHDWLQCSDASALDDYLAYFQFPQSSSGNARYYDVRMGPVHLFSLNSSCEPDGVTADSVQARWVRQTAQASDAPFKIAAMHHPPWSSGAHRTDGAHMQWPWAEWGFQLVLGGHEHDYERIWQQDVTSAVVGIGGTRLRGFGCPVEGSQVRFADDHGALLIEADVTEMRATLHTADGEEIDTFTISLDGTTSNTDPDVPAEDCEGTVGCGCASWLRVPWVLRP